MKCYKAQNTRKINYDSRFQPCGLCNGTVTKLYRISEEALKTPPRGHNFKQVVFTIQNRRAFAHGYGSFVYKSFALMKSDKELIDSIFLE